MSSSIYPLESRSQAQTPSEGSQYLFRDSDNGGILTAKNYDCSFTVIGVSHVHDEEVHALNEMVNKIIDDAGCSLKKGIITSDQYESIVDNLNMCISVNVDPVTGSHEACISNTPTLFVSLALTHVLCNGGTTGTATPTITGGTTPYAPLDWGGDNPAALSSGMHTLVVTDAAGKNKSVSFIITEPLALSSINSSTPETGGGSNGTATVAISGGTAPYTYLWDDPGAQITPTATGLAAGNYNCVITDANGCVLNEGPIVVA